MESHGRGSHAGGWRGVLKNNFTKRLRELTLGVCFIKVWAARHQLSDVSAAEAVQEAALVFRCTGRTKSITGFMELLKEEYKELFHAASIMRTTNCAAQAALAAAQLPQAMATPIKRVGRVLAAHQQLQGDGVSTPPPCSIKAAATTVNTPAAKMAVEVALDGAVGALVQQSRNVCNQGGQEQFKAAAKQLAEGMSQAFITAIYSMIRCFFLPCILRHALILSV